MNETGPSAWTLPRRSAILSAVRTSGVVVALAACSLSLGLAAALRIPASAPSVVAVFPAAPVSSAPRIRVGLRPAEGPVKVGSSGGPFFIYSMGKQPPIWPERLAGAVMIVPEGGAPAPSPPVRRVQIGSFRDKDKAQTLAGDLEAEFHAPASAAWDPDRNVWRVRIGEAESAEALTSLLASLRQSGYPDAWLVSEPRQKKSGGALRLIDGRWDVFGTGAERLLIVPGEGDRITVEGKEYRGLLEARLSPYGVVQLINELSLEDYLRGVVPLELGPGLFPELDAQKVQAVAARTYALANLGQFQEEGFDVCDTPRCQVYGGATAEHPVSDRAVRETAGQVLAFNGEPINALFTATCGGHTEDVEVVFPEWRGTYLRGVPCFAEDRELERVMTRVIGAPLPSSISDEPSEGRAVLARALLIAADMIPLQAEESTWRAGPLDAVQWMRWTGALAKRAGRPVPPAIESIPDRLSLWRWLGEWTRVSEDAPLSLLAGDERVLIMSDDRSAVPSTDWPLIAELLEQGLPLLDQSGRLRPADAPTRGEAVALLARLSENYAAAPLLDATVLRAAAGVLRLKVGREERELRLGSARPLLLAESPAGWYRVAELSLLPGDKVAFLAIGSTLELLGVKRRQGRGDDRRGTNYRWTEVRDAAALEESFNKVAPVGRLKDLTIVRRGVSGRVAELSVEGAAGRAIVQGFRIRRALDLPEILFTMSLQKDDAGFIRRATFRGRGWGHGVGMCQTGAFGMALRGRDYREILAHYYPGSVLVDGP